jgi:site-specific recombinase XerD
VRFRAVQQFFRWAVEEGEIEQSPMARMHPPIIPEEPPPVLGEDALRKLLVSMSGKSFAERRDMAISSRSSDRHRPQTRRVRWPWSGRTSI